MNREKPPETSYWTAQSIDKIAARFNLPNEDTMQDWAYEVADPKRLAAFVAAYEDYKSEPDIKYTLMDIILQSLEESSIPLSDSKISRSIRHNLISSFDLHAYQIWYWSAFDVEKDEAWRISPFLRKIWNDVR